MGEMYEGDPVFPEEVELPDDSGPATAMQHNVVHETNLDRTRYLKVHVDAIEVHEKVLHALNFPTKADPNSAGIARWGLFRRSPLQYADEWWVFSSSKTVERTVDNGHSYSGASLIGGGVGSGGEDVCRADCDATGNVVATINGTTDLFTYATLTDTWAKNTSIADATSIAFPQVVYDPVHDKWCFAAVDGTGAFTVCTSTDRATWTAAATPPAEGGFQATKITMGVNKTTGRILLIAFTADEELYIRVSDDGGVTWSAIGAGWTSGVATPDIVSISCANDGVWMFTLGNSTSLDGEVWKTVDDGATWEVAATFGNAILQHPAVINIGVVAGTGGRLWCAIAQEGPNGANATNRIVYSLDDGATWKRTAFTPFGSFCGVFAGAGGFLVLTSTNAYMGLRAGAPDHGALA